MPMLVGFTLASSIIACRSFYLALQQVGSVYSDTLTQHDQEEVSTLQCGYLHTYMYLTVRVFMQCMAGIFV